MGSHQRIYLLRSLQHLPYHPINAVEEVVWISEHQGMMGEMSRCEFKPVLEQEIFDSLAIRLVYSKPEIAVKCACPVFQIGSYFV